MLILGRLDERGELRERRSPARLVVGGRQAAVVRRARRALRCRRLHRRT